jgi:hypothetical protein
LGQGEKLLRQRLRELSQQTSEAPKVFQAMWGLDQFRSLAALVTFMVQVLHPPASVPTTMASSVDAASGPASPQDPAPPIE